MKTFTEVKLDSKVFADQLCTEEAFKFIKDIDAAQHDWDFTLDVAKYFIKQIKKLEKDISFEEQEYLPLLRKLLLTEN